MLTRWSQYFLNTLREDPKDAESVSHKLMMRAGLVRRVGSGAYAYLPFGLRALQKVMAIIREEMNRAGAQELLMPAMTPVELWKATGRYDIMGDVLIRFKDRTGKEVVLAPTHEEVITELAKEARSHKQLPVILYQIQTKFRDEPRPRFGVIRTKEFLMKDAYSFDASWEGLGKSYDAMYAAYQRIFSRAGLKVLACEADSGAMGGDVSHEFMAPSEAGEDRIAHCVSCGYAANLEAAKCLPPEPNPASARPEPMKEVQTPGQHTVEQVSRFLNVPPAQIIKTLIYEAGSEVVAVLVRGDHEVNEAKLARVLRAKTLRLASVSTIQRVSGAPVGFAGPVGLNGAKLVADPAAAAVVNAVAGANKAETHALNVNIGRDAKPELIVDIRFVTDQDICPKCKGKLDLIKAIEVGHVFKLGTRYSEALGALVQDASGGSHPMIMGCYGIGVNRVLASAIEQLNDKDGLRWPRSLAPFDVIITIMETGNEDMAKAGENLAEKMAVSGLEILLDDRQQSPGSKLKDADLVGIPVQVIFGKTWLAGGQVEIRSRASRDKLTVEVSQAEGAVRKLLDTPPSL